MIPQHDVEEKSRALRDDRPDVDLHVEREPSLDRGEVEGKLAKDSVVQLDDHLAFGAQVGLVDLKHSQRMVRESKRTSGVEVATQTLHRG